MWDSFVDFATSHFVHLFFISFALATIICFLKNATRAHAFPWNDPRAWEMGLELFAAAAVAGLTYPLVLYKEAHAHEWNEAVQGSLDQHHRNLAFKAVQCLFLNAIIFVGVLASLLDGGWQQFRCQCPKTGETVVVEELTKWGAGFSLVLGILALFFTLLMLGMI